jgi:predicted short-subunit dehydrogenase-like oxidoreductase (DUF2520 family)
MKKRYNIIIIGRGNVATHLAKKLKARCTKNIFAVNTTTDIIILAVKDDAIAKIANQLKVKDKIVVHTSGGVDMNVLKKCSENYGVLYPFQTISKKREVNWKKIPICIEANNKKAENILFNLASKLAGTKNVHKISSEQRKVLHLAAIFACNFTNHLYAIAEDILRTHNLSFDLLKPLIIDTANKILELNPAEAQTGPAKRNDKKIMSEHLNMLAKEKNYFQLYKLISKSIMEIRN